MRVSDMSKQHGAAEARRAHNPEDARSKRAVAIILHFLRNANLAAGSPKADPAAANPNFLAKVLFGAKSV